MGAVMAAMVESAAAEQADTLVMAVGAVMAPHPMELMVLVEVVVVAVMLCLASALALVVGALDCLGKARTVTAVRHLMGGAGAGQVA